MRKILFFYVVAFCMLSVSELQSMQTSTNQESPKIEKKKAKVRAFLERNPWYVHESSKVVMDRVADYYGEAARTHIKFVQAVLDEKRTVQKVSQKSSVFCFAKDVSRKLEFDSQESTRAKGVIFTSAVQDKHPLCVTTARRYDNYCNGRWTIQKSEEYKPCVAAFALFLSRDIGYSVEDVVRDIAAFKSMSDGDEERFKQEVESRYPVDLGFTARQKQAVDADKAQRIAEEKWFLGSLVNDLGESL